MRKPRENKHNRVYHLISRIAHRAFFLSVDGDARVTRFARFASANTALVSYGIIQSFSLGVACHALDEIEMRQHGEAYAE